MSLPGKMALCAGDARTGPAAPLTAVAEYIDQDLTKSVGVQRIDQHAVLTVADDVARTTVFGRHDRQTTGRGLEQCQTERFRERRIDEHPVALRCEAV